MSSNSFTLIASIVALVGSVVSAGIAAWAIFYSDHRKQLDEAEKAMSKYRDPLLLAAYDLERKLWVIANGDARLHLEGSEEQRQYLYQRTCFQVGQYFAWTYILRNETQFLRFSKGKRTKLHTRALGKISEEFSEWRSDSYAFRIWTGEQEALGEEMMIEKGEKEGQRICMGFGTFRERWTAGKSDDPLFVRLKNDIDAMSMEQKGMHHSGNKDKILRVQHLLVDLVDELDPDGLYHISDDRREIVAYCHCNFCLEQSSFINYSNATNFTQPDPMAMPAPFQQHDPQRYTTSKRVPGFSHRTA